MPYILLGIGIFLVGLSILLPEKKQLKKRSGDDIEKSYYETASTDEAFYDNLNTKLDGFIDELGDNVHLASDELDKKIAKLASLQESIDISLQSFGDLVQKAGNGDKGQHLPQKHKDVLALNQKGLNVAEIATRLDVGKGEIELILSLYEEGDKK